MQIRTTRNPNCHIPLISVLRTIIFFSPRWAARLDPSTVPFHTHPISNVTLQTYHFQISLPILYHHTLINHQAWIQTTHFHKQKFSHNSTIEQLWYWNPDEFADQPIHFFASSLSTTPYPNSRWTFLSPFFYTDATPIFSPITSDPPDPSSTVDEELENELDIFITL